jgi:hypothetical protein
VSVVGDEGDRFSLNVGVVGVDVVVFLDGLFHGLVPMETLSQARDPDIELRVVCG